MAFPRNEPDEPVAGNQLKTIVERIERLNGEENDIKQDKAEVYAEARANGFDVKVLRKVVAIRRRDPSERAEEEAILDLYLQAVGDRMAEPEPSRPEKQRVGAPAKVEKPAPETVKPDVAAPTKKPIVGSFTPPADEIPPDDAFGA